VTTSFYVPRFEVRIAGTSLAADVTSQVVSLTYDNNSDLADMFTLVLHNPDNRFSDSPLFDLGKRVEIYMGYRDELKPMMLGEITAVEPDFPQDGSPRLTISGYDRSYKLRQNEPSRAPFQYVNDSAIAAQLAAEAGLIPVVDPSFFFHEYIQQTGTDMAFLKERAEANFFEVFVYWDQLFFRLPRPPDQAIVLNWGSNLSSFAPRLASAAMAGTQVIRGYDEKLANAVVAFATGGDVDLEHLTEKLGDNVVGLLSSFGRRVARDHVVESPIDAATLAKSLLQELMEGMYEGSGSCIGLPELRAGQVVEIRGVGQRFSGMYRLRRVTHTMGEGGYQTSFEVTQKSGAGMVPLLRKAIAELPSPNKQRRYFGSFVAKVTQNQDPEQRGRIKVSFPWFSDNNESHWARVATPMGGNGYGMYFLPEVGDEVLVSFQHGDFRKPMISGSLWNGRARPPQTNADGQNNLRVISTRSGHSITLDDTTGKEQIVIHHKGGGEITLASDNSVTIHSKGPLNLRSDGTMTLDAPNVNVKVSGAMDVSARTGTGR